MTRFDQLQIQVRQLTRRLTRLEAAQAAPVPRPRTRDRRRASYVDIGEAEHLARVRLWARYQLLKRAECTGKRFNRRRGECAPWTVESFVARVTDAEGLRFNLREFIRWFADANTHAVGARQDQRISAAIRGQIAAMIASGVRIPRDA